MPAWADRHNSGFLNQGIRKKFAQKNKKWELIVFAYIRFLILNIVKAKSDRHKNMAKTINAGNSGVTGVVLAVDNGVWVGDDTEFAETNA